MSATKGGPWGQGVAWDATSGAVFVTGNFAGSLDTGTGILTVSGSSSKLGNDGHLRREARPAQPAAGFRRRPGPRPPDSDPRPTPAGPGPATRPLAGPRGRHLPPRPHRHRHRRPRAAYRPCRGRRARPSPSTPTLPAGTGSWVACRAGDARPSSGRIDLLSALTHEVGHLLGHEHHEGGVMAETLAPDRAVPYPAPGGGPTSHG